MNKQLLSIKLVDRPELNPSTSRKAEYLRYITKDIKLMNVPKYAKQEYALYWNK
jgi:hypothetical protein